MKVQRVIAIVSLLLNAALLIEVYFREWREIDRFLQDAQVSSWAGYAGAMQAELNRALGDPSVPCEGDLLTARRVQPSRVRPCRRDLRHSSRGEGSALLGF